MTVLIGHDHAAVVGVDGGDPAGLQDQDLLELAFGLDLLLQAKARSRQLQWHTAATRP